MIGMARMKEMKSTSCDTCKYLKVISDGTWHDEIDCKIDMWDYFQEDIECPRYVELIEEPNYPRWMEE